MADQSSALSLIRRMAGTLLGVKPKALEGVSLADAGAEKIDVTMLVLEVEAEFAISISDVEVEQLKSCEDFARLVARKHGVPYE